MTIYSSQNMIVFIWNLQLLQITFQSFQDSGFHDVHKNNTVDIQFSAHDAFLEYIPPG